MYEFTTLGATSHGNAMANSPFGLHYMQTLLLPAIHTLESSIAKASMIQVFVFILSSYRDYKILSLDNLPADPPYCTQSTFPDRVVNYQKHL
jgi:hypothetical protein